MTDGVTPAQQADSTSRHVAGRVVRGTREGQTPLRGQWVVLHRVGPDRAGPLDSTRTNPQGQFEFRYHAVGDSTALYFVSSSYGGVAYFTSPLRGPDVRGDDALITVFDTTSGPVDIKLGGRHLIIGAVQPNGRRPVGEVFDLVNDTTVTRVARDSLTPVWSAHLPDGATNFQLNTNGELSAASVSHRGSVVGLYAPLSPGIRQLAYTYELPATAFPLQVPTEQATGTMEVLLQDPRAVVHGPAFRETAPVATEGRTFRRFLAQDIPPGSVVQIDEPKAVAENRQQVYLGVAVALLIAMVAALAFAARRSMSRVRTASVPVEARSQTLLREIAMLDSAFERSAADAPTKDEYERRRSVLKEELSRALAQERNPA